VAEITAPRPLSETDDRSCFDRGRESMNHWFWRHAWANRAAGISRTNVIRDGATSDIVGYVTLSAGQIKRAYLPKSQQRNKPDPVPATLFGQLAVQKDYQGRGLASSLLLFALRTALRASREIGSFGVITQPIDGSVRGFYGRWGFQDLPFDPHRAMIVRMVDLERSGIEQKSGHDHEEI
jgi:GNAT superfamily N-acetyltransferase